MKKNQKKSLKPLGHPKGSKNPRRGSIVEKEKNKGKRTKWNA